MRIAKSPWIAVALFVLGTAPLSAKPVYDRAEAGDGTAFRNEAIQGCVDTGLPRPAPQLVGDMLRRTCACAVDRYMDGRPISTLPPADPGTIERLAYLELRQCAREVAAGQAIGDAAPVAPPELGDLPAASTDKPAGSEPAAPADGGPPLVSRLLARIDASGIPRAGWIAIAILGLVLLRLLFRRRQSNDLMAPPHWMRPGSRAAPPPPPTKI